MKLAALSDRGAKKDFVDLYALTRQHKPLPELLTLYQRRYQIENISPVIYAINYFDDADRERLPPMLWDVGWREMKRTIQGWVRELAGSGPSL